jgi:hypothetical protein
VTNPNYIYRRRLLSVGYAEIEGLFISDDSSVFVDSTKREEYLTTLRLALVSAFVEHVSLLSDADGNAFVLNIDNIDFPEIVYFRIAKKADQNKTVQTNIQVLQRISSVQENNGCAQADSLRGSSSNV